MLVNHSSLFFSRQQQQARFQQNFFRANPATPSSAPVSPISAGSWGVAAAWFDNQNNGGEEGTPLADFLLPRPSSSSPETFQTSPSENQAAANRKNPKAEDEMEILVTSPGNGISTEECIDIIGSREGRTNGLLPGQTTDFDNCDQSMEKVVWPVDCENGEQNTNTERVMGEVGVKFFPRIDPGCLLQGGAFFWLVPKITPQHTQALYQQAGPGLRAIEDNPPLEFVETSESPAQTRVPANDKKRRSQPNMPLTLAE